MPEAYPLAALLSVRNYREDAAKRAVSRVREEMREAEAAVKTCEADLEAWRQWRVEETERRSAALIGKRTTIAGLDDFNRGLAALANDELVKIAALDEARRHAAACLTKLDKAREEARNARRNTAKIEVHRDIWTEEARKAAEHAEDLELEEFKSPMNRLGQGAEDDTI